MKTILLILITMASVVMAAQAPMTDAEMKTLLAGDWIGDLHCRGRTFTFQPDGKLLIDGEDPDKEDPATWDVKSGKLIGEGARSWTILLLTKHEFVARGDQSYTGYLFLTR